MVLVKDPVVVKRSADLLFEMAFWLVPHSIPLSVSAIPPLSVTFPEIVAEKADTGILAPVVTVGILVRVV
jgi:hypothetical protein